MPLKTSPVTLDGSTATLTMASTTAGLTVGALTAASTDIGAVCKKCGLNELSWDMKVAMWHPTIHRMHIFYVATWAML